MPVVDDEATPAPAPQVCQRCRRTFPGDPSLLPGAMIEWWACPECRASLLGTSAPAESGSR